MADKTPEEYARELMSFYSRAKPVVQEEILPVNTGGILVITTTLRGLYPVEGALVTVFTGEGNEKVVMQTSVTDESGKSDVIRLTTPPKYLSESAGSVELPYAEYNISVVADGYIEQTMLAVPVFPGIISTQKADLVPISAANKNKGPTIIREGNGFDL